LLNTILYPACTASQTVIFNDTAQLLLYHAFCELMICDLVQVNLNLCIIFVTVICFVHYALKNKCMLSLVSYL
jgi:hypothetical protein